MAMLEHRFHEERPWGDFDRLTLNERATVKLIEVAAGQRLSLQSHEKRSEWWKVLAGSGTAQVDDAVRAIAAGDEVEIPQGAKHRVAAGDTGLRFLEIALGEFDEHDIVRYEDDFGRA